MTGKVSEDAEIKLINDCGEETIIYNFGNQCWQKSTKPEPAKNWSNAEEYCQNLALANYTDWRLPALDELWPIRNYIKTNSELFKESRFWTSAPHKLEYKNYHAYVDVRTNYKNYAPDFRDSYGVKCIRDNFID
ncbi:DUF1566 domain-containing protein [Candidatus Pacearchaeota archaeon]|nr:DUF1566 domain-containing protein [Candidatus Pacearchaeota archaeon]